MQIIANNMYNVQVRLTLHFVEKLWPVCHYQLCILKLMVVGGVSQHLFWFGTEPPPKFLKPT